jgi:DNA repair exonuclease SbcCD ATPase subunit
MAENTIEIEVELKGQKDVTKQLEQIKKGAKDVGEGFKGVTSIMDKSSSQIGEGLSTMSDSVESSIDAFSSLKEGVANFGKNGVASFTSLLSPIGLVTTAVAGLWEGYRMLSGAAAEAEARQEAMAAASADLTSKLEALAEGGVIPTTKALLDFSKVTLQSQVSKELLQRAVEKAKPQMEAYTTAMEAQAKAQREYNALEAKGLKLTEEGMEARKRLTRAEGELIKAKGAYEERLRKLEGPLQENLKLIAEAAEQEKKLEENTTDNLKAKVKEQAERLKVLRIAEEELYNKDQLVLSFTKEQIALEAAQVARKSEDMSRQELIKTVNDQREAIRLLDQEDYEIRARSAKARRAYADADKKLAEEELKRGQAIARAREQAQRTEASRQMMLESQLRQLQIKLTKEGDDELLALAKERYNTGLQLAKDNALQRQIVEAQYQLDVQQIEDRAIDREYARLQKLDQEAEAKRQKDRAQKQKDRDAQLNADKEMLAQASEYIDMYGQGLAQAGVQALMFGGSFKEAAGEVLKGLAVESGVRALMETAKGFAALLINPALAGGHFKSAALFGAAAGAARVGAGALGVGGAGGASGGATASPSGAPQTAPAPQREQAECREMVFNLNFGGAVIYDTKEAAKRAMLGDLVRTYNQPNRGMPRFSSAR